MSLCLGRTACRVSGMLCVLLVNGEDRLGHLDVKGGGKTYHCGGEKVYHRGNA